MEEIGLNISINTINAHRSNSAVKKQMSDWIKMI